MIMQRDEKPVVVGEDAQDSSGGAATANGNQEKGIGAVPDEVIGLQFINGRILYFSRSTLAKSAGGYFAARFGGDDSTTADNEARDLMGRRVYFVERDCEIFEKHILPFILTRRPGELPPFAENRALWRTLREEAQFYGLQDLTQLLYVTHRCIPRHALNRGVLYYIGTSMGTSSTWNPSAIGTVDIHRDVHYLSPTEQEALPETAKEIASGKVLVQYRPAMIPINLPDPRWLVVVGMSIKPEAMRSRGHCHLFSCCGESTTKVPTILDLKTITLRLTAYSLHHNACGMKNWYFEGSKDGKDWKALKSVKAGTLGASQSQTELLQDYITGAPVVLQSDRREKIEMLLDQAESERRHLWKIVPSMDEFYRYFRFIALDDIGQDMENDGDGSHSSLLLKKNLDGVGLELFGDLHED